MTERRHRLFHKIMDQCSLVDAPYPELDDCWMYNGPDSGNGRGGGYGRIRFEGGTIATHIAMWVIENGPVPSRKQLDHLCRRRKCCNPSHLECVTHKQNQKRRAKAKNGKANKIRKCNDTSGRKPSRRSHAGVRIGRSGDMERPNFPLPGRQDCQGCNGQPV